MNKRGMSIVGTIGILCLGGFALAPAQAMPLASGISAKFPQAQTTRHCLLAEGDAGEILNSKTGKHYDLNDPCVGRGTTVVYNEEATTVTTKVVKEFLTTLPSGAITKN